MIFFDTMHLRCLMIALAAILTVGRSAEAQQGHFVLHYGQGQTTLPVTVVYPSSYDRTRPYPVILTLPPGAGNAAMVTVNLSLWQGEAQRRGYIIIAPQIQGQQLQSEGKEVLDAIFSWMNEQFAYSPDRVTLTGQSNGGIGAFYLALYEPNRFNALIVLPGVYPGPKEDLRRLKGKRVWMMVGSNDVSWKKASRAVAASLEKAGAQVRLDILPGQNHILHVDPADILDWIESDIIKTGDR